MLVDGASVAGVASVSAWMQDGHGYASADLAGNLPIPWTILCNANTGVCTGTVSGNVTQVFANGKQIGEFLSLFLLLLPAVVVVVRCTDSGFSSALGLGHANRLLRQGCLLRFHQRPR
jgi:hypothetical protein